MTGPRILLVRFSSLGDVLLLTPLIRVLRTRHPAATITALTKECWAPLLSANPHLTEVITAAPGDRLVALARQLRKADYTHHLDLHGSVRSRVLRLLVPGPWHGYDARRRERKLLLHARQDTYRPRVPVPERYFEAARSLDATPDGAPADLFVSPAAELRAEDWLTQAGLIPGAPLVGLVPGAAHATKRWPLGHWKKLARALTEQGLHVVVIGGPADIAAGTEIVAALGRHGTSAAGRLDLQASGALIRRTRVVVTGDSGPMHLATAVRTPVVALFGPTVEQFGFFPYQARASVLEQSLPCRPCSSKGGPRCPLEHHRCLTEILPEEVMARTLEWLG